VRIDHAYTPAASTDIRKTFARLRRQQRAELVARAAAPVVAEPTSPVAAGPAPRRVVALAQVPTGDAARPRMTPRRGPTPRPDDRDVVASHAGADEPRGTRHDDTWTQHTLSLFTGRAA
jgi:hypothetical protein